MAFTQLPIASIVKSPTSTDTVYPTLDPVDGPPTPDTVGPGAANQQPQQLDYRTETLRDRVNKAITTLNEMTTELLQRGGSTVSSFMKGDLDMTDPTNSQASRIINMADGSAATDAVNKGQLDVFVDEIAAMQITIGNAVLRDGTVSMSGHLDLGTFKAVNCADPTVDTDIATKGYVDTQSFAITGTYLKRDGTNSMNAAMNMADHRIVNCANPTNNKDAVTVDYLEDVLQGLGATPVGTIGFYTGVSTTNTPPPGWEFCDGRYQSIQSYPDLFALIGHTFRADPGGGNFYLPDLRGRVVCGMDNFGQGQADPAHFSATGPNVNLRSTMGGTSGTETHPLSTAELPSHTHSYGDTWGQPLVGNLVGPTTGTSGTYGPNPAQSLTTSSMGSGTAHQNVQPTMAMQVIIKT